MSELKHVASISGGRTSHFMISVLLEKYGKDCVDFVYCDTGAEQEGTYKFIKETSVYFDIDIACIRLFMPKEVGKGGTYEIIPTETLKKDYTAFISLMEKYGRPYNPSGKFCTDQMKTQIYRKYCNDKYGKGNYITWIGYRNDPKDVSRVWGHSISGTLSKWFNIPQREQGDLYITAVQLLHESRETLYDYLCNFLVDSNNESNIKKINNIIDRVIKNKTLKYKFLFEISDFDKNDILDWWEGQHIDLNIPEHSGNCIFCIEKTVNQLSYLCHTLNKDALEWKSILNSNLIPSKERKLNDKVMYRNGSRKMTFDEIYDEAMKKDLTYWEDIVMREKRLSPCATGSCDLYNE